MAIIAFWSDEGKETGQTMSMVALSTYMAIEHNYRVLNVSANFKEQTLEHSYWDMSKMDAFLKGISKDIKQAGELRQSSFESGVEGLVRVINSNKTSNSIVSSYTNVVFKDHLDVLGAPKTQEYEEYRSICELYPDIIQVANRDYDVVFVDVSRRMPEESSKKILEMADVIIVNITQRMEILNKINDLKSENEFFKQKKIVYNIGRYDKFSKFNTKNVSRYIGEKREVFCVPYNTLFFESCSEGKVAELFLRIRKVDPEDRNATLIEELKRFTEGLIYKLKELQVKI
ncbi:MAG: hypothetical protein J6M60_05580 [Clostridia bacterium]|nr:hypothetical protein [Clostridia bacterium]